MNDGTPFGVRVQEGFMAAVLIGPTTKTLTLVCSSGSRWNVYTSSSILLT
jgi:hypothetical protein